MNDNEKCPQCGWSMQDVNELTVEIERLTAEKEKWKGLADRHFETIERQAANQSLERDLLQAEVRRLRAMIEDDREAQ